MDDEEERNDDGNHHVRYFDKSAALFDGSTKPLLNLKVSYKRGIRHTSLKDLYTDKYIYVGETQTKVAIVSMQIKCRVQIDLWIMPKWNELPLKPGLSKTGGPTTCK